MERPGGDDLDPNDQVIYRLSGNQIERSTNSGTSYFPLTAPEILITRLQFYVIGAPGMQPRVTIIVEGEAGPQTKTKAKFSFQETITQRTPNAS